MRLDDVNVEMSYKASGLEGNPWPLNRSDNNLSATITIKVCFQTGDSVNFNKQSDYLSPYGLIPRDVSIRSNATRLAAYVFQLEESEVEPDDLIAGPNIFIHNPPKNEKVPRP